MVEALESRRLLALTITEFPISMAGSSPGEITAGPDGNLWFTDTGTNSIGMINPVTHAVAEFPIGTSNTSPAGITAGPDGNLWFADGNGSIGMINPTTHAINEFPIPTAGSDPDDIALGPDGNLWFTDENGSIGVINPTTHAINEFAISTSNGSPAGITAGPDGNLWFADGNGSIGVINPTTHAINEFPVPTADSGPEDITTGPDGNLWFTDDDGSIGMINPSTDAISEFPIDLAYTASVSPQGITAGPDGILWFADGGTNAIGTIDPATDTPVEFPTPTATSSPYAITTGPDGNLWFTEQGVHTIGEVVLDGTQPATTTTTLEASLNSVIVGETITFTATVSSAAGAPIGNLNFLDGTTVLNPAPIPLLSLNGAGTATFSTSTLAQGTHTITAVFEGNVGFQTSSSAAQAVTLNASPVTINEFPVPTPLVPGGYDIAPEGITLGPDGNLWFTEDGFPSSIGMINPTTDGIATFPLSTSTLFAGNPLAITTGPDGNLWFTLEVGQGFDGSIGMIDPTTHAIAEFDLPATTTTYYTHPIDITAGPDGNLWFTGMTQDSSTGVYGMGEIGMINPSTAAVTLFPIPTAGSEPMSITAGPDGNLWFTDAGTNQIGMINPATDAISEFPLPAGTSPGDITTGPDGNLWLTVSGGIGMFSPTTDAITQFAIPGGGATPQSITATPDGNLWFTDPGTNSIGVFSTTTDAITEFPIPKANSEPDGITAGPDGRLWFTESSSASNRIGQVVANSTPTTTTLTASANPATAGQTISFTATVASPSGTPSGGVNFLDGTTVLNPAPVTLDNTGTATFTTAPLAEGTHSITAVYAGNSSFATSTSAALSLRVNAAAPTTTTTTLTASANPATAGQTINFTASVTSSGGTPSGSVNFLDGTTVLNLAPIALGASGTANFSTSALAQDTHSITAVFVGNSSFATSTSAALSLTVNAAVTASPTTTTVTASANPATASQPVTFTATVTSSGGTPSGSVNFLDGTTVLNPTPVALDGTGSATFSIAALPQGTHSITAVFVGNSSFATSTSAALSLTVNAATTPFPTMTTLTVVPNPAVAGQTITFTAVVSTGGTPAGGVNFFDGTTPLNPAPVPLDGTGTATFSMASLAAGLHTITAVFLSSGNLQGSSSQPLSLTVMAPSVAPQAAGVSSVSQSRKGVASITIAFNEALDPSSASNTAQYSALGGVKKRGKTVYNKHVAIKSVSYNSNTRAVTITLAKPYKGAVQVTVNSGLKAANGAATNASHTLIAG